MLAQQAFTGALLPAKLRPTPVRANRIKRRRLLDQLHATAAKLTIIQAPAGFGKTTLLTHWAHECDAPVAWLALDPADNALPTFYSYVIAAVAAIDRDLVEHAQRHLPVNAPTNSDAMFTALLSELAYYAVPWAFVIEDYHVIDNPDIDHAVRLLIEHTPEECRIIIASRTEPALPLARLRLRDELTVLTADDLRVTVDELAELLEIYGLQLSSLEQLALTERTDGWMAALHLTLLASRAQSLEHVLTALSTFDGNLDLLGEYLQQEVLDQQSQELRTFLLETAILERFTADACYAVTGSSEAGRLLEQIQRRRLFVTPLDDTGQWQSYHHLFGDFLRRRGALELDPSRLAALHAAASYWFEQQELIGEAVNHATKCGDWTRAANVLAGASSKLILRQAEADMLAWLRSFPRDVLFAEPNLSSIAAYALVRHGQPAEAAPLLDAAEARWRAMEHRNGLSVIELVRGAVARISEQPAELVAHSTAAIAYATGEQALDADGTLTDIKPRFPHLEDTWVARASQMTSYAHLAIGLRLLGRVNDAAELYERIEAEHTARGMEITSSYLAPEYAAIRIAQGRLHQAEAITSAVLQHGERILPSERMYAYALQAAVLRQWNRLDEAEQFARDGLELAARFDTPILMPHLYLTLARSLWSAGDTEAALASLDAATATARRIHNLRCVHEAAALRIRMLLADDDLEAAARWAAERAGAAGRLPESATITEHLTYARVLVAQAESARAIDLLRYLQTSAAADKRADDLIRVCVLLSLAHLNQFELEQAVEVLQQALELGEANRYMRVFMDEGPALLRLLRVAQRRGIQVRYIQLLFAAAGAEPGNIVRITHRDLVEPITTREIEVLQLLGAGLTNREISDELVISVATTKRHISNLYGKLSVSSRSEAVQRARKLGLFANEQSASSHAATDDAL